MRFITPSAPRLRREPPIGKEWAHEIKWDGWRLQAHKRVGAVTLCTRNRRDVTQRFKAIADAIGALGPKSLVLDGELVAFDENNRPDFHLLRTKRAPVIAFLFDVLEIDGEDLRGEPWRVRRRRLERLMARNRSGVLVLPEVWDDGPALLRAAAQQGLEGIVSKHREAPYRSGDTDAWIKVKVAGWTESNRGRFKR